MQITIQVNKGIIEESFIYAYLPRYIYDWFVKSVDISRLAKFDEFFGINSFDILSKALRNLLITKNGNNEYTIKTDKDNRRFFIIVRLKLLEISCC